MHLSVWSLTVVCSSLQGGHFILPSQQRTNCQSAPGTQCILPIRCLSTVLYKFSVITKFIDMWFELNCCEQSCIKSDYQRNMLLCCHHGIMSVFLSRQPWRSMKKLWERPEKPGKFGLMLVELLIFTIIQHTLTCFVIGSEKFSWLFSWLWENDFLVCCLVFLYSSRLYSPLV